MGPYCHSYHANVDSIDSRVDCFFGGNSDGSDEAEGDRRMSISATRILSGLAQHTFPHIQISFSAS